MSNNARDLDSGAHPLNVLRTGTREIQILRSADTLGTIVAWAETNYAVPLVYSGVTQYPHSGWTVIMGLSTSGLVNYDVYLFTHDPRRSEGQQWKLAFARPGALLAARYGDVQAAMFDKDGQSIVVLGAQGKTLARIPVGGALMQADGDGLRHR